MPSVSPLAENEVDVRLSSSMTEDENEDSVEICKRYDTAPADTFQISVGFAEISVALLVGETSDGGNGLTGTVMKLQTFDHALVPPEFIALTRQ